MVKNKIGGNKAKRMGRKFVGDPGASKKLRMPDDPDEIFACATRMLGNGMFEVMCDDGDTRLCYMAKKFKGRGKRDNCVTIGCWMLVGKRSWECSTPAGRQKRLDKCDLLEVYNNNEKDRLKELDFNWTALLKAVDTDTQTTEDIGDIIFTDEKTIEYQNLIINNESNVDRELREEFNKKEEIDDDEINIDDI
tara:strand:+ start:1744 stop:2322 length:579 start_codon:yes stop_codon:yes gene_type:complete